MKRPVDTAALWTGEPGRSPRLPTVLDQVSSHLGFPLTCSPCPPAPPPLPSIYITFPGEGEPASTLSTTALLTTGLPRGMRKAVAEFERGGSWATGLVWHQAGRGVECRPSSSAAWWWGASGRQMNRFLSGVTTVQRKARESRVVTSKRNAWTKPRGLDESYGNSIKKPAMKNACTGAA